MALKTTENERKQPTSKENLWLRMPWGLLLKTNLKITRKSVSLEGKIWKNKRWFKTCVYYYKIKAGKTGKFLPEAPCYFKLKSYNHGIIIYYTTCDVIVFLCITIRDERWRV